MILPVIVKHLIFRYKFNRSPTSAVVCARLRRCPSARGRCYVRFMFCFSRRKFRYYSATVNKSFVL